MSIIKFERIHTSKRVRLWIDQQGFELAYDCSAEGDMTVEDKMDWIERQVIIALHRLADTGIKVNI